MIIIKNIKIHRMNTKLLKKMLVTLAAVAFSAFVAYNVSLGLVDYDKGSTLLTLEALADGEAGGGESSTGQCRTSKHSSFVISYHCDCPNGNAPKYIEQTTYICVGNNGGYCKPGTVLTYYDCNGDKTNSSDLTSTAYCSH
jgi:hypothetical protein